MPARRPASPPPRASFKRQVRRAAFALTMVVAGGVGLVAALISLQDIPAAAQAANQSAVDVLGTRAQALLSGQLDDLERLSSSSLVWTALTDSAGRETYLEPFLDERNRSLDNATVALLDYQGRFVAGQLPDSMSERQQDKDWLQPVVEDGRATALIRRAEDLELLVAYPVRFPYSQDVIGILLGRLSLTAIIGWQEAPALAGRGLLLQTAEQAYPLVGDTAERRHDSAGYRLALPGLGLGDLRLVLYARAIPWTTRLVERLFILVLAASLLGTLVWWLAGVLAERATRRVSRLAEAILADPVAGPEAIPVDDNKDEIGVLSRALRMALNAHAEAKDRLHDLAYYDQLTGLVNRVLFQQQLQQAMERAQRQDHGLAMLFIDLDRFKTINDSVGHEMGDQLLQEVAALINRRVRRTDVVSRRGGDEFTILLDPCDHADDAARVARQLVDQLDAPVTLNGGISVYTGASIGIALYPQDGQTSNELLRNADAAMYKAKENGKGCYRFYSRDIGEGIERRLLVESRLRQAMEEDGLAVMYQPQVDLASGRVVGIEALCRWHDGEWGDVPPSHFIAIAEDSGLIGLLGEQVLRRACTDAQLWLADHPQLQLAVNLSPQQLGEDLVGRVAAVLTECRWPGERLELEFTESAVMNNSPTVRHQLEVLRGLGVSLAIDDFGTGYSSLSYLKHLAVNKLKIDRSFIRDLGDNADHDLVVSAIITIAHHLRLTVVAEGVETPAQRDILREFGCDILQGNLISPPVDAAWIPEFLARATRPPAPDHS